MSDGVMEREVIFAAVAVKERNVEVIRAEAVEAGKNIGIGNGEMGIIRSNEDGVWCPSDLASSQKVI
jgi:hypothetical protein